MSRCEQARPWRPGDADGRCQECGHPYQPWFTDNWLWNTVMGGEMYEPADPGGFLCPSCFAAWAEECWPNIVWRFIPEWSGRAPLMDFPRESAVVGDALHGMRGGVRRDGGLAAGASGDVAEGGGEGTDDVEPSPCGISGVHEHTYRRGGQVVAAPILARGLVSITEAALHMLLTEAGFTREGDDE